jgi:oxygen-independent coproporphyrinogen-3 oxidase
VEEKLSLYIHIPFCAHLCDYCDFFSVMAKDVSDEYIDRFLNAVVKDINYQLEYFNVKEIPTVYIGGGTPSVLGQRIAVLFDVLKRNNFSPVEFTVEANPESVTEEFLEVCLEGGVNRLSLGVQTFYEPSRILVNRTASDVIRERLALASRFFPKAISVDLITGLPLQTEKIVLDDIKRILDFTPAHVSLYSLITESGTNLNRKIKEKKIILPDNDSSDSLWLASCDALKDAGFRHYEVSNFARNGSECLHNIRYWRMEGWLGAGPAASGTVIDEKNGKAKRYTYAHDIDAYIASPEIIKAAVEDLDSAETMRESLLMGYRFCEGPDLSVFKQRFGRGIEECIPRTLSHWKNKDKMLFLNSFLSCAFSELEENGY